jgi:hypothetical protein
LKPLGAEVFAAIADHPVDAAPPAEGAVSRAQAVEVRGGPQALAGTGHRRHVSACSSSCRRGRPCGSAVPGRAGPGERTATQVPVFLAALQRLTGRAEASARGRRGGAGLLASRFDPRCRSRRHGRDAVAAGAGSLGTPPVKASWTEHCWLAAHQAPDGSFGAIVRPVVQRRGGGRRRVGQVGNPAYDVGVTGLALNAFLVAGTRGRGPTVRRGRGARAPVARFAAGRRGRLRRRDVRGHRHSSHGGPLPRRPRGAAPSAQPGLRIPLVDGVYNQAPRRWRVEAYGLTGDAATKGRSEGLAWIEREEPVLRMEVRIGRATTTRRSPSG